MGYPSLDEKLHRAFEKPWANFDIEYFGNIKDIKTYEN